jgi:DNA-directed RNA polymerase subunit RPC12/RpoP
MNNTLPKKVEVRSPFCPICGKLTCNCSDAMDNFNKVFEEELKEEQKESKPYQKRATEYECMTCHERMVCVDDVVTQSLRLDFLECPKCKSRAEVEYNSYGTCYIKGFKWWR